MANSLRERITHVGADLKAKSRPDGWVLPKERASFAEEDDWTNIDQDVTPLERRTWTSWTILGFWMSDAMNAQGIWFLVTRSFNVLTYLQVGRRPALLSQSV
jgi:NCS1 family nucleobase:cation symporter-1